MKTESLVKCSLLTFFALLGSTLTAKTEELITLKWEDPAIYSQGGTEIRVPSIEGQMMDGKMPNFSWTRGVSAKSDYKLELEIIATEPALRSEVSYLRSNYIDVGDLSYQLSASKARQEKYIVLNLFPFVKIGNTVHRVTDVKLTYSSVPVPPVTYQKDFVTNSVLQPGSGTWYKITVSEDGIYKLDKAFLSACGIDVENVNPQNINIFGNGDGRLPELNSKPRTDDLAKNAIQVIGEGDGTFDDDDYILFYG